jgi:hypothetical protein
MFIYAGLVAAAALAGDPSEARPMTAEAMPQPIIPSAAPIARRDI